MVEREVVRLAYGKMSLDEAMEIIVKKIIRACIKAFLAGMVWGALLFWLMSQLIS